MDEAIMARGPTIRIPSVSGAVRGGDLADFARRVGAESVDVDVAFDADIAAIARHGLGKRYSGGVIIGVSAAHDSNISVATPEAADDAGYDPSVYVLVLANTAFTGTVKVWML
jgi:hypothetical protein